MSESCECISVRCCSDNPFNYSLVAGTVYENDQVAIEFECPPGLRCTPGTYVIPAGRIRFAPTNTESGTLRLLCCESEIVRQVPAGATESEIGAIAQSMANDCARQLARCTAAQTIRFGSTKYSEEVCANGCANQGLLMGWIGAQPKFPSVVFFREGSLCLVEGAFASQSSIAAATASAQTFIDNYATSLLFQGVMDCGWWNTEQICPDTDPPEIIPAFSAFSTISQDQANQNALDQCPGGCEWTPSEEDFTGVSGVVTGGVNGIGLNFDGAINAAPNAVDPFGVASYKHYLNFEYTGPEINGIITFDITTLTQLGAGGFSGVGFDVSVDNVSVAGAGVTTDSELPGIYPFPFTIPASVAAQVSILVAVSVVSYGGSVGGIVNYTGALEGIPCE